MLAGLLEIANFKVLLSAIFLVATKISFPVQPVTQPSESFRRHQQLAPSHALSMCDSIFCRQIMTSEMFSTIVKAIKMGSLKLLVLMTWIANTSQQCGTGYGVTSVIWSGIPFGKLTVGQFFPPFLINQFS